MKKAFPTFAVIVLLFAVFWLLSDLGVITVSLPWFPVIIGVIALGWIINHYFEK